MHLATAFTIPLLRWPWLFALCMTHLRPWSHRSRGDSSLPSLAASSVSRQWQETIAGCSRIQYQLELWKAGFVCGLPSSMPTVEKRQALAKHQRAWRRLEWRSKTAVKLPALLRTYAAHALVAGIFAFQENGPNIYTLPLQEDSRVTKHVLEVDPGTSVLLTMDPTQDLLAVAYYPVHGSGSLTLAFRSLSVNQPHPMARHPTIPVGSDDEEELEILMADDVVGIAFADPGIIRVWNWRTGALLADVEVDTDRPDFQFISPRAFVTACRVDSGCIDIFMITPEKGPNSEGAVHVARLWFPEAERADGESLWEPSAIGVRSGPLFLPRKRKPHLPLRIPTGISRGENWMRLMVHHRTLAGYVSRYVRQSGTDCIDLEWEDWGPRNTRVLPGDELDGFPTAHGERVVILGVDHEDRPRLEVLNFGVIPGDDQSEDESHTLVLGQSTIRGAPFEDPVTTYLPFRRTVRAIDADFESVLMDQEHIIVENQSPFEWTNRLLYDLGISRYCAVPQMHVRWYS
ncbi:hypothetical protein FB45DRAFT_876730 [Roridomyces roridus]|uniref:F-box domain-containing protein n=1 Tax=Roridomyces roridus TaxID=1738132 RepID=A0AAD7FBM2_9AGAR|nr:hypothetical protein FB45DRAFT_876730 [Roridomyces roridus]